MIVASFVMSDNLYFVTDEGRMFKVIQDAEDWIVEEVTKLPIR